MALCEASWVSTWVGTEDRCKCLFEVEVVKVEKAMMVSEGGGFGWFLWAVYRPGLIQHSIYGRAAP
jgi:hypothetical protein